MNILWDRVIYFSPRILLFCSIVINYIVIYFSDSLYILLHIGAGQISAATENQVGQTNDHEGFVTLFPFYHVHMNQLQTFCLCKLMFPYFLRKKLGCTSLNFQSFSSYHNLQLWIKFYKLQVKLISFRQNRKSSFLILWLARSWYRNYQFHVRFVDGNKKKTEKMRNKNEVKKIT